MLCHRLQRRLPKGGMEDAQALLPAFKWESFVKHVMAVQTEPFRAETWAGRMPADVYAESGTHPSQSTPSGRRRCRSIS